MSSWIQEVREGTDRVFRGAAKWWDRLSGREERRRLEQQAEVLKWVLEASAAACDWLDTERRTDGPLISIVMPVWNRATTVRASIDSVISQTYGRWELLVVDDGRTDGTAAILSEFAADARVRVLSGPHQGEAAEFIHEFIQQTLNWSDLDWQTAQARAIESAKERLADEVVYRPLLNDWLVLTNRTQATLPLTRNTPTTAERATQTQKTA